MQTTVTLDFVVMRRDMEACELRHIEQRICAVHFAYQAAERAQVRVMLDRPHAVKLYGLCLVVECVTHLSLSIENVVMGSRWLSSSARTSWRTSSAL